MTSGNNFDVIVIGGGAVGCACARELASDHSTLLLEKGQIAGEATGLAAGLIGPSAFLGEYPRAVEYVNEYLRELDGEGNFKFNERPRLMLIPEGEEQEGRQKAIEAKEKGLDVEFLEPEAISQFHPEFDISLFSGAIKYNDHGWVDPYTYTNTLKNKADRKGADIRTHSKVEEILTDEGKVIGVETGETRFYAPNIVCAAGWRTRDLVDDYVDIPIKPFYTQSLVLDLQKELRDDFPMARWDKKGLYLRPEENGDLLVGSGLKHVDDPGQLSKGGPIDDDFRLTVAETLPKILPAFSESAVIDGWGGVDGGTIDHLPILDAPEKTPNGLIIATGFSGLGIMHSPVGAATVRELVTGESTTVPLEPFSLKRFDLPVTFPKNISGLSH